MPRPRYVISHRTRFVLAMAQVLVGMAIAPWNVLAAGKIRTDEEEERRRQSGERGASGSWRIWKVNGKLTRLCTQAAQT